LTSFKTIGGLVGGSNMVTTISSCGQVDDISPENVLLLLPMMSKKPFWHYVGLQKPGKGQWWQVKTSF